MKSLKKIFDSHTGNMIYKWNHYFEIYEKHFNQFKNSDKQITVLEIGVLNGGSLQLWKEYFGKNSTIYGIDIHPDCYQYQDSKNNIYIRIGSQADPNFLKKLLEEIKQFDIIIDDGSHRMKHQIESFKYLWSSVKEGGIYLVEDTHSSYWNYFGGGRSRSGTFIQYTHRIIDSLHAWYSEQRSFKPDEFTKTVNSITYYDSIVVFEKKKRTQPYTIKSGLDNSADRKSIRENLKKKIIFKIGFKILFFFNKVLQVFKIKAFLFRG